MVNPLTVIERDELSSKPIVKDTLAMVVKYRRRQILTNLQLEWENVLAGEKFWWLAFFH